MTQLPPKKEVALALLERSNVDVYLDPRAAGVVVPPQFRKEPRLILKIGLNMPVPIPDLHLDEESMSCTLSFSRTPFYCVVPWSSVFAMVGDDGRGMVWPDDVPQELAVRAVEEPAPPARPGPQLEAVPSPKRKSKQGPRAVESAGGNAGRAKKGGGAKKKKDERPALVAVPPSAPSAPAAPPSERAAPAAPPKEPAAATPSAPSAPTAPSSPGARPKRELPPYLRVVK